MGYINRYEESLVLLRCGLAIAREENDTDTILRALHNMGSIVAGYENAERAVEIGLRRSSRLTGSTIHRIIPADYSVPRPPGTCAAR